MSRTRAKAATRCRTSASCIREEEKSSAVTWLTNLFTLCCVCRQAHTVPTKTLRGWNSALQSLAASTKLLVCVPRGKGLRWSTCPTSFTAQRRSLLRADGPFAAATLSRLWDRARPDHQRGPLGRDRRHAGPASRRRVRARGQVQSHRRAVSRVHRRAACVPRRQVRGDTPTGGRLVVSGRC